MSSFDWLDNLSNKASDLWDSTDWGTVAQLGAGAYLTARGVGSPTSDPVGYQGKVVKRVPIRERVPQTYDPNRRPGEAGRRYFTSTQFLDSPQAASNVSKSERILDPTGAQIIGTEAIPDRVLGDTQIIGTTAVPDTVLSDNPVIGTVVVPETIDDPDNPGTAIPNPAREGKQFTAEGYEILDTASYDPAKAYTSDGYEVISQGERSLFNTYTDDGFLVLDPTLYDPNKTYSETGFEVLSPSQREEGKQYTAEGFEVLDTDAYDPDATYSEEGVRVVSPEGFYTQEEIARQGARAEALGLAALNEANPVLAAKGGIMKTREYNRGGNVQQMTGGRYLAGTTDGMADEVPSSIDGVQPAALSDGEFVIPADVVSHLGNGNSTAGAKVLDDMMTNVRKARTGNPEQGKEINPQQVMSRAGGGLANLPQYASGGTVKRFSNGGTTADEATAASDLDTPDFTAEVAGTEDSLANWAGDYVTDFLGRAQGLADLPYEAYTGPLTAGASGIQQEAFGTAGTMDTSGTQMGAFDQAAAQQYMNPYMDAALQPQIRLAQEEAARQRLENASRMTQAGSYGGSRQAILEALNQQNLAQNISDITAQGYNTAYEQARDQFGREKDYGLAALQTQGELGRIQRDIAAEGIAADKAQFEEERDFEYKMPTYLSSLLQGLPTNARNTTYTQQDSLSQAIGNTAGVSELYDFLFQNNNDSSNNNSNNNDSNSSN